MPVSWLHALLLAAAGYLAASANIALILHWMGAIDDPRRAHSGNPGVSNVYRIAGLPWAALVLLLEMGRAAGVGLLAVLWLPPCLGPVAAVGLVAGNRWPLAHGFRGGKGVANLLGFAAAFAPLAALAAAGIWLAGYALFRRSFLASFGMVATLCAGIWLRASPCFPSTGSTLLLLGIILAAHRPNLRAWLAERHEEPRG